MNEKQLFDSLSRIFSKEELRRLTENTVYKNADEYGLFNQYSINKEGNSFRLDKDSTYTSKVFHSLRNAVIWASLDKSNQVVDAARVEDLDILLTGTDANLEVHKRLAEKTKDTETRVTYLIKLQEDRVKRSMIIEELNDYAKQVTKMQEKRFKQISK